MAKTTKKKTLSTLLVVVLLAVVAIGGMLAYLTDRDSEANVFTVGDVKIDLTEDFQQGATLTPGVDVKKEVVVKNTGKNNAWVWVEIAVPAALDNDDASKNILHFNYDKKSVGDGLWNWKIDNAWNVEKNVKINDDPELYNVYTVMYQTALKPGEVTPSAMTKVYLDTAMDIDPDGNWYKVVNGEATAIEWDNSKTPMVYVSAYAIQEEGFKNVKAAYDAYQGQWGTKGEYASVAKATDDASLDKAIKDGESQIVLGDGNYIIPDSAKGKELTITGNGSTVIATQDDGSYEGCDYSLDGATVTFNNVTINTDSSTYTGYARLNATYNNCTINGTYTLYGNSTFNNCEFNVSGDVYNIWTWGAPNATFNNCTFNSDGKALLLYGQANTKLTIDGCTFNDKGGLTDKKAAIEIGNDYNTSYNLIVNNTTVNGYESNDKGINTGTTLWGNKNSMGTDKLNVVVDGVDVY